MTKDISWRIERFCENIFWVSSFSALWDLAVNALVNKKDNENILWMHVQIWKNKVISFSAINQTYIIIILLLPH